jgi:hypothetical protein
MIRIPVQRDAIPRGPAAFPIAGIRNGIYRVGVGRTVMRDRLGHRTGLVIARFGRIHHEHGTHPQPGERGKRTIQRPGDIVGSILQADLRSLDMRLRRLAFDRAAA